MSYGLIVAVAITIVALFIAGFGTAGYVVGGLAGRRAWNARPFITFLARYAVVFGLLFGLEMLLLWLFPAIHQTLRNTVAAGVAGILRLAGTDASVAGSIISLSASSFNVTVACLGGILFWVYLALVLAEPRASRRQRLKGICTGLGLLLGFNILRITLSVYLEGTTGLRIHDSFYLINMLAVLLVWAVWIRSLRNRSDASPNTVRPDMDSGHR